MNRKATNLRNVETEILNENGLTYLNIKAECDYEDIVTSAIGKIEIHKIDLNNLNIIKEGNKTFLQLELYPKDKDLVDLVTIDFKD